MARKNSSFKINSLIKLGLVLSLSSLGILSGEVYERTPSRSLEAKSIATYQNGLGKVVENELKKLVAQKEAELWNESRLSKDATIVKIIPFHNETIRLEVSVQEYLQKKKVKHVSDDCWESVVNYVQPEDAVIERILYQLKIPGKNLEEDAKKILDFTHSATVFIEDLDSYPKSPTETIVEGGGDCEDLQNLNSSLMRKAGMDIVYIALPEIKGEPNGRAHFLCGVNGKFKGKFVEVYGKKYYFADATETATSSIDWKIGEIHPNFEKRMRTAQIYLPDGRLYGPKIASRFREENLSH